jgi:hypothetical protein
MRNRASNWAPHISNEMWGGTIEAVRSLAWAVFLFLRHKLEISLNLQLIDLELKLARLLRVNKAQAA